MLKAAALIVVFCSKFYAPWCFFFFLLTMRMCPGLNPSCHTRTIPLSPKKEGKLREEHRGAGSRSPLSGLSAPMQNVCFQES